MEENKNKTVKMSTYILSLVVLIVVFGIFFLTRPKTVDPDTEAFMACKTADDYRAYMRSYGTNALHYGEAKDFVDKFVADSMQKVEEQAGLDEKREIGTTEVAQEGRNGVQAITTKKIFNKNGKLIKEEQVSAFIFGIKIKVIRKL